MSNCEASSWSYNFEKKTGEKKQVCLKDRKEDDIHIRITHFAIITTDLFAKQHSQQAFLGSQAFGRVQAIGPKEGRFNVGDRVAVGTYRFACGDCRECHKQRDDLCRKAEFTSSPTIGGYSTSININNEWAYPVPNSIPDEAVPALVSDGAAIYSALKRHVPSTQSALCIVGSKAMGQLALSFAKGLRYSNVTVLGDAEDKSAVESKGGKFQELSSNKAKFDAVLICTTSVDSDLYNKVLDSAILGGKVIVVSHPVQTDIRFGFFAFVASSCWDNSDELELVQNLAASRREIYEALYFAAVNNIQPTVELHQFDEVPSLVEKLGKEPYRAYQVVKH